MMNTPGDWRNCMRGCSIGDRLSVVGCQLMPLIDNTDMYTK